MLLQLFSSATILVIISSKILGLTMKRKQIALASDTESRSFPLPTQKRPAITQATERKNKKMCGYEDRRRYKSPHEATDYDIGQASPPPPPPSQNQGMKRSDMAGFMDVISNSILEIKERLTDRECVWLIDDVLDDKNDKLNSLALTYLPAELRILYVREKSRDSNDG